MRELTTNGMISDSFRSAKPTVGMPATFLSFTDRHAGTVSEIISPKKIRVERCDYKVTNEVKNYGDNVEYEYLPRSVEELNEKPEGSIYTLRKNGKWIMQGASMDQTGLSVMLGAREEYYDPHF